MGFRRILTALGLAVTSSIITLSAVPAHAAPAPDCKTVVTQVVNRPDNGHGTGGSPQPGYWADDTHKRTVTICRQAPAPAAKVAGQVEFENYTAKAVDDGTFVTRAGATLSPNNGASLVGGVKGKFYGTFQWEVQAPANWNFFNPSDVADKTVTGDPRASDTDNNPTTSQWINGWWPGADVKIEFLDNWDWLYWLCGDRPNLKVRGGYHGEYWWDAAVPASNDGQTVLAGDIRGKQKCPTPSASASASASVSPSVTVSTTPVAGLPVTGVDTGTIVWVGIGLLTLGILFVILAWQHRRRRPRFIA